MNRTRKLLFAGVGVIAMLAIAFVLAGPVVVRSVFYPKPEGLPAVVSQTTEQLLARLENVLRTNAPLVAGALRPGLSDAEIAAMEAEGGFRLSDDLRILYRWRNGMVTNSAAEFLPGQRFLPLEDVMRERSVVAQQEASATALQRAAYSVFAGHRKYWVHIFDDGAGDGYFYDPNRRDSDGAFFFHFAEVAYYVWFPSVRNFLAGVIECYETEAVKVAADGKSLEENSQQTEKIWARFGRARESF